MERRSFTLGNRSSRDVRAIWIGLLEEEEEEESLWYEERRLDFLFVLFGVDRRELFWIE